ncbi:glutathione S-transferase [Mariannaea sp. PMI_226]|nr:glutathione S-transferase [Mariannaea sp. PMI_226]
MVLKFYFAPYTTANVTIAVLAELEDGQSEPLAERVEVSLRNGDTHTAQYLAEVNPNGQVPAIVHDGVPIWESAAITMYLGEMFGVDRKVNGTEASLYPPPGPRRGEAMKWIVWTNLHFGANAATLHRAQSSDGNEAEGKRAKDAISTRLDVLNRELEGKDYVLGSSYSLADTHLWSFVSYLYKYLNVDLTPVPNVKAWVERVAARRQLKDL